jgi:hypothetical protein
MEKPMRIIRDIGTIVTIISFGIFEHFYKMNEGLIEGQAAPLQMSNDNTQYIIGKQISSGYIETSATILTLIILVLLWAPTLINAINPTKKEEEKS